MTTTEPAESSPSTPQDVAPGLPAINVLLATLLSVTAGLLIALRQLDGLIGQVLDSGEPRTPTGLSGPRLPWMADPDGWRFLFGPGSELEDRLNDWLTTYVVLDVFFALAYGALLFWWCRAVEAPARVRQIVALGVAADLLESLLIVVEWAALLPWFSSVKWAALAIGVLWLAVRSRARIASGLRHLGLGLYTHRYSAIIVLPLALLGLGTGPDLLEQVPDIQRRWIDDWEGARHFAFAGGITLLLALAAFATGRQRSDHLYRRTQAPLPLPDEPRPPLLLWFLGPALLAIGAGIAVWRQAHVAWAPLVIFGAVPLLVGGLSGLIRRFRHPEPGLWRKRRREVPLARFESGALLGDLLPGLLVVVAGLGAIRSFTAVVALGDLGWALVLLAAGCFTLLATWWGYRKVLDRLAGASRRSQRPLVVMLTPGRTKAAPESRLGHQPVAWAVFVGSLTTSLWLALWPSSASNALGVVATFQLAVGALSLLIASVVILLQTGGAPEVFWKGSPIASPFVPVTTLVVAACASAAIFGGSNEVHGLRDYPPSAEQSDVDPTDRPEIPTLFDHWLASEHHRMCRVSLGDGYSIRPLLLYAAEGGGIRAAYWTASGVDKVFRDVGAHECGAAFLSSGASGGAVGLSVASVTTAGEARAAVTKISGPDPLAAAVTGLVIRDTIFAATGIPLPPFRSAEDDGYEWVDRAGLIEEAWESEVEDLDDPWLEEHSTWDWPTSGPMVLNATSATTGCRAVLSQVRLGDFDKIGCTGHPALAGSSDLVECTGQLRTSTVALLASRFPYVTPSAAKKCGTDQQYVDGGYAENTGIGTLVDLAPQVLAEVRAHNDCVLRPGPKNACRQAVATVVVPLLLYFDNGTGSDLLRPTPKPTLELIVPPLTKSKAKESLYSADSQLQRARAALQTSQLWSAETEAARAAAEAVDLWLGCESVYVMYQRTSPGIAAPLGWVLSKASREPMDDALGEQEEVRKDLPYGTLEELILRLRASEPEAGEGLTTSCPPT